MITAALIASPVLPFESGATPFSHFGGTLVMSAMDVRNTFMPFFPYLFKEPRFSSVRGDGGLLMADWLMLGCVFAT